MKNTMKEVVVVKPHHTEVREVPVPVPGDDEVLDPDEGSRCMRK